jgi:hypothetical protein
MASTLNLCKNASPADNPLETEFPTTKLNQRNLLNFPQKKETINKKNLSFQILWISGMRITENTPEVPVKPVSIFPSAVSSPSTKVVGFLRSSAKGPKSSGGPTELL